MMKKVIERLGVSKLIMFGLTLFTYTDINVSIVKVMKSSYRQP